MVISILLLKTDTVAKLLLVLQATVLQDTVLKVTVLKVTVDKVTVLKDMAVSAITTTRGPLQASTDKDMATAQVTVAAAMASSMVDKQGILLLRLLPPRPPSARQPRRLSKRLLRKIW